MAGTFVDRHRKRLSMQLATAVALGCFALAATTYLVVDTD